MTLPAIITQSLREDLLSVTWEKEGIEIEAKAKRSLRIEDKRIAKVLITKGVPEGRRGKLWMLSSGAMIQMINNRGYYAQLLQLSTQIHCKYAKQIDLDMNRSLHKNNLQYIASVRNILLSYSIRNSSIGYCQGFNFLCEMLFNVIGKEEDTFWLFAVLIEEILPLNYYSELSGVIADTSLIMNFLPKYFPSLKGVFEEHAFINTFLHKWLLSLFCQSFNKELTYLIWDYLFLEGSLILIKAVLGIFSALKKDILESKDDAEGMFILLSQETASLSSRNASVLYALALKKFEFNDKYIDKTRLLLSLPIMTKIDNENKEKRAQLKQLIRSQTLDLTLASTSTLDVSMSSRFALNCNPKWPSCLYDTEMAVVDYLVVHTKDYAYHANYFFSFGDNLEEEKVDHKPNQSNILIERKPHCCSSVLIDSSFIDHNHLNDDSTLEELPVYKKLSNVAEFINAQDTIKHQFNPHPYHIDCEP